MQLIKTCLVILALAFSSFANGEGTIAAGLSASRQNSGSPREEFVRLVSRLRFELRKVEPESARCSELAGRISASDLFQLLRKEQTESDDTQVGSLIAASSMLKQQANKRVNSLVNFLDECANELGAHTESIGEQADASTGQEVVVDAGAAVEKATAELKAEKERLEARVSELEAIVERSNETKQEDELVKLVSRLRGELRNIGSGLARCSVLSELMGESDLMSQLMKTHAKGDSPVAEPIRRLIVASSLLSAYTKSLTSNNNNSEQLVAFLNECAKKLGAKSEDLESIGAHLKASISQEEQAAPEDAGALVEKATAELKAEKERLEAQVSELEAAVRRLSEVNEANKLEQEASAVELTSVKYRLEDKVEELAEWKKKFEELDKQYGTCYRQRADWIWRADHMEEQFKECEQLRKG